MKAKRSIPCLCLGGALLFALLCACSPTPTDPSASVTPSATAVSPSAQGSYSSPAADSPAPEETSMPAPDFTLADMDGEQVSLSDFRGRIVVLNFWASWCPPCKEEMPDFQTLYENWSTLGEDAPVLLAIDLADGYRGETVEQAKTFLAEEGYSFPVLFDETGAVASVYTNGSIPTTHIIDQQGNVYASGIGMVSGEAVQEVVDELMEGIAP